MTQSHRQACPLCSEPAAFTFVHEPDGKRFSCPTCVAFFIDESSEHEFERMADGVRTDFKRKASDHARASGPGRLFVLREPRPEERGGDGHGVARKTIVGEWVKAA